MTFLDYQKEAIKTRVGSADNEEYLTLGLLVFVGAGFCFYGNLNCGVGLALIGLMAYLTDEELCSNAVYNLFKRKAEEWRSSDEKH